MKSYRVLINLFRFLKWTAPTLKLFHTLRYGLTFIENNGLVAKEEMKCPDRLSFVYLRAVFNINYSDQSQQKLTIEWTNQSLKRILVSGAKRGKTRGSNSQLVFGFASDWLRNWREIFKPIINANLHLTILWYEAWSGYQFPVERRTLKNARGG